MLIRKSDFILGFPKRCGHCQGVLFIFFELTVISTVDSGGAGAARAPPEFWGSEEGKSLISAFRV